ncbi:uncharacterized protein MKK02DRAFT_29542 [Dioszegia hungarica]|uniref:F-box domain-containing protein n=1 Tax=Dioszegia hungarica TaxID=4972 RepID=A0AA38LX39_9TREE|nr:uncharacterized protein MKK02DRAFT_29542 [Dioszegia hungarica]KAI9639492.1 hypothetical protein MKK02DRAFT_29542 [Dioszegia hungarica]
MAVPLASIGGIPADDIHSRACLGLLPEHILREVAFYSDEKTLWRMMAVCRGIREAVESELRPYLAEKEVICTPLLVPDKSYKTEDPTDFHPNIAEYRRNRLRVLRHYGDRFDAHLLAYAPATTHLRRLIVETGVDDQQVGWDLAIRFAPQLSALEVHVWDTVRNAHLPLEVWPEISFPHLTNLVIATCQRPMGHLRHFLTRASVPLLRHLTISSPTNQPTDGALITFEVEEMPPLEHIFATGSIDYMPELLADLNLYPSIRYVAVREESGLVKEFTLEWLGNSLGLCDGLKGLALLGFSAADILEVALEAGQTSEDEEFSYLWANLEMLVLEEELDGAGISEPSEADKMLKMLADANPHHDWIFDSLRQIVIVGRVGPDGPPEVYHLPTLFDLCRSLEYVVWIATCPDDPFSFDPTAVDDPTVLCCVRRPTKSCPLPAHLRADRSRIVEEDEESWDGRPW